MTPNLRAKIVFLWNAIAMIVILFTVGMMVFGTGERIESMIIEGVLVVVVLSDLLLRVWLTPPKPRY